MADKKPVWVDEDAHALLKKYSKLVKSSMVDLASRLVLDKLNDLSPEAGLEAAPAAPAAPEPEAPAPPPDVAPVVPKTAEPRRTRRAPKPDPEDQDVRYLGGVWLV